MVTCVGLNSFFVGGGKHLITLVLASEDVLFFQLPW
jgi:hypothetical protein